MFASYPQLNCFDYLAIVFLFFLSLFRQFCELHRVPKDYFITGQLNTVRWGTLDKENMFCVLREVNYEREETDLPKTLTEMYMSIQTFYSARTKKLFKKTAFTLIRLLILELNLLQCDDFNRGHSRLFNPSEADSLTKNFDFVFLKANQICS